MNMNQFLPLIAINPIGYDNLEHQMFMNAHNKQTDFTTVITLSFDPEFVRSWSVSSSIYAKFDDDRNMLGSHMSRNQIKSVMTHYKDMLSRICTIRSNNRNLISPVDIQQIMNPRNVDIDVSTAINTLEKNINSVTYVPPQSITEIGQFASILANISTGQFLGTSYYELGYVTVKKSADSAPVTYVVSYDEMIRIRDQYNNMAYVGKDYPVSLDVYK